MICRNPDYRLVTVENSRVLTPGLTPDLPFLMYVSDNINLFFLWWPTGRQPGRLLLLSLNRLLNSKFGIIASEASAPYLYWLIMKPSKYLCYCSYDCVSILLNFHFMFYFLSLPIPTGDICLSWIFNTTYDLGILFVVFLLSVIIITERSIWLVVLFFVKNGIWIAAGLDILRKHEETGREFTNRLKIVNRD